MSALFPHPLLTLHVGQAGIQIGHACWELMCLEHNINKDGTPRLECGDHGNIDTMFIPTPQGRYFPRSIFVDTDPFCVDEVRSGPYRGLFSARQLLSDELDSGTNYATGRYGYARRLLPETVDRLRWLTEKADVKPTVLLVHSACGGTGSGFAVASLHQAAEELGITGQSTIDLCVVPGRMASQTSCELLNTALYMDEAQSLVRQTFCVSNSALFRVCSDQLQSREGATYAHVNRILAAAFSNLTATERLPGSSVSLSSVLDSLLPFPHLKYPVLACAPYLTPLTASVEQATVKSATAAVLEAGSQFLDVDPRRGRHSAGFLLYRGAATFGEIQKAAADLIAKGRVQFSDWAPAGFRTGLVALPPLAPPGSGFADPTVSVTMVTSHSGIAGVFQRLAQTARRLQENDLFVHNYEGAIVSLLTRGGRVGSPNNDDPAGLVAALKVANNSLRDWMAPTAIRSNSGLLQQQQQQQNPRHREASAVNAVRSCAISDVFGVRVRLSMAIDYLDAVAKLYAEDGMLPPKEPEQESDDGDFEADSVNIEWQEGFGASEEGDDLGGEGAAAVPAAVTFVLSAATDDTQQLKRKQQQQKLQRPEVQKVQEVDAIAARGGALPRAEHAAPAASEYESTVRWAAQLEQTDEDTPQSIQQQQQQQQEEDRQDAAYNSSSDAENVSAAKVVSQQQQQSQHQPEENGPPGWSSSCEAPADEDIDPPKTWVTTAATAVAAAATSKQYHQRRCVVGSALIPSIGGWLRRKKASRLLAKAAAAERKLNRKQEEQQQQQQLEQQFSWSPRRPRSLADVAAATPERHPAVLKAEKILLKYQSMEN